MNGVSDLWEVKGGSHKNTPTTLSHTAPAGPRRMQACLFGLEGKVKKENKGKKLNPNLQHTSAKAAKLLWKQAASSTALYQISKKQILDDSPGLGLFPNTRSLQGTPNLTHQTHMGLYGLPYLSNYHNSKAKASGERPKYKVRKQTIKCQETQRK